VFKAFKPTTRFQQNS